MDRLKTLANSVLHSSSARNNGSSKGSLLRVSVLLALLPTFNAAQRLALGARSLPLNRSQTPARKWVPRRWVHLKWILHNLTLRIWKIRKWATGLRRSTGHHRQTCLRLQMPLMPLKLWMVSLHSGRVLTMFQVPVKSTAEQERRKILRLMLLQTP